MGRANVNILQKETPSDNIQKVFISKKTLQFGWFFGTIPNFFHIDLVLGLLNKNSEKMHSIFFKEQENIICKPTLVKKLNGIASLKGIKDSLRN